MLVGHRGLWDMVCCGMELWDGDQGNTKARTEGLQHLQQEKVQPQEPRHAQWVHSGTAPYVRGPDAIAHLWGSLPPHPHRFP